MHYAYLSSTVIAISAVIGVLVTASFCVSYLCDRTKNNIYAGVLNLLLKFFGQTAQKSQTSQALYCTYATTINHRHSGYQPCILCVCHSEGRVKPRATTTYAYRSTVSTVCRLHFRDRLTNDSIATIPSTLDKCNHVVVTCMESMTELELPGVASRCPPVDSGSRRKE